MKISRLYSKLLTKCDLRGKYYPNRYVRHDIKFFRQPEILMDIKNCEASINSPRSLEFCSGYCSQFNIVKYNKYFEGDLAKLYSYKVSLQNMVKKAENDFHRELKTNG